MQYVSRTVVQDITASTLVTGTAVVDVIYSADDDYYYYDYYCYY